MISNHGKFNSYLTRFKLKYDPYYDLCDGVIDSSEHKLYDCQLFDEQRDELIVKVE
jgi:hypothetical protein